MHRRFPSEYDEYNLLPNSKITPKIHIILFYIKEFIEKINTALPLGNYSEHAFETVHYDFVYFYERYKRRKKVTTHFETSFFNAIVAYNLINF